MELIINIIALLMSIYIQYKVTFSAVKEYYEQKENKK